MKIIFKILLILLVIYFLLLIVGSFFGISTVPSLGEIIDDIKHLIIPKSDNPFDHYRLAPLSK